MLGKQHRVAIVETLFFLAVFSLLTTSGWASSLETFQQWIWHLDMAMPGKAIDLVSPEAGALADKPMMMKLSEALEKDGIQILSARRAFLEDQEAVEYYFRTDSGLKCSGKLPLSFHEGEWKMLGGPGVFGALWRQFCSPREFRLDFEDGASFWRMKIISTIPPVTMGPDRVYDSLDGPFFRNYLVQIPLGNGKKSVPEIVASGGVVMTLCQSDYESLDGVSKRDGKITWHIFRVKSVPRLPTGGSSCMKSGSLISGRRTPPMPSS